MPSPGLPLPRLSISFARCLLALLILGATGKVGAQSIRPGLLVGRVTDASGGSVEFPVLRVSRAGRTYLAEGEADGDFRIDGLSPGKWIVSVRRAGYRSIVLELEIPVVGLRRDFTLTPLKVAPDPALVASGWKGVRGLVTDARGTAPLVGARIRLLGDDASASTDSLGRFSLALPAERDFVLRVERTGFATRLLTGRTPGTGYVELEAPLDTTDDSAKDYWVWRDLERRLRFATPRAARVTRVAIEATGALTLGSALEGVSTVAGRGLVVPRNACLFVNGLPRPGFTADAFRAEDVEFVEVYPAGTELTRTLAGRWPANGVCGVAGAGATDSRQAAQAIVVWLRVP